jgi:hypothetical protein
MQEQPLRGSEGQAMNRKRRKSKSNHGKRQPKIMYRVIGGQVVADRAIVAGGLGFILAPTARRAQIVDPETLFATAEAATKALKLERGWLLNEYTGVVERCYLTRDGTGRLFAVDRVGKRLWNVIPFTAEARAYAAAEALALKERRAALRKLREKERKLLKVRRRRATVTRERLRR